MKSGWKLEYSLFASPSGAHCTETNRRKGGEGNTKKKEYEKKLHVRWVCCSAAPCDNGREKEGRKKETRSIITTCSELVRMRERKSVA